MGCLAAWLLEVEAKQLGGLAIICVMGLFTSLILHELAGFGGRQELYSAEFREDGRIVTRDPHPDFIAELPEL